jgi:hypothetical protein
MTGNRVRGRGLSLVSLAKLSTPGSAVGGYAK